MKKYIWLGIPLFWLLGLLIYFGAPVTKDSGV